VIIVGIMAGLFTATEAAAIAVMYVFIIAFIFKKQRNIKDYIEAVRKAVIDSSIIYILIASAAILSWVLTYYQTLDPLVNFLIENEFSPTMFLILLTLFYFVLETFMEPNSAILLFLLLFLRVKIGLVLDLLFAVLVIV